MRAFRAGSVALAIALCATTSFASFYDFEQITVATVAIGFTSSKIRPSGKPQMTFAQCRLELAEIRYTYDGTTPTTTVGTLMQVGEYIGFINAEDLGNFKAIRTTGTSGQLNCTYKSP